jgi:hypothetical protein
VRLAHEQGILSKPGLNFFQQFGLLYWLYMSRRQSLDDTRSELEQMTFNLDERRWSQIYLPGMPTDLGGGIAVSSLGGEDAEVAVTDIGDLDSYFESLDKPRTVTAAAFAPDGGWT